MQITLTIYSTGGTAKTNLMVLLPRYGWVWYHPDGIANILSLSRVAKKFRVTYNSGNENIFHVHVKNGKVRSFRPSPKGLYYSNISRQKNATVLVNTVEHNKNKYSDPDYSRALLKRKIQNMLGNPSYRHFCKLVKSNQLGNCPILE